MSPTDPKALEGCNPVQHVVFLPPDEAVLAAVAAAPASPGPGGAAVEAGTPPQPLQQQRPGSRGALAGAVRTPPQSSEGRRRRSGSGAPLRLDLTGLRGDGAGGGGGYQAPPLSPRRLTDSGVVSRSPRGCRVSVGDAGEEACAVTRSLARLATPPDAAAGAPAAHGAAASAAASLKQCGSRAAAGAAASAAAAAMLSPQGVAALSAGLQGNTHLTRLVLSGHPVACGGVQVRGAKSGRHQFCLWIRNGLRLCTRRPRSLHGCALTRGRDACAVPPQALVAALSVSRTALAQLFLRGCGLALVAARALGALLGSGGVCGRVELDLGENPGLAQDVSV